MTDHAREKSFSSSSCGEDPTAQESAKVGELSVLDWARERHRNTIRIAAEKTGADRDGWLEDEAYWREIVSQLASLAASEATRQALELEMRSGWWINHGCPIHALYGDDGEMQCNAATCMKDFKREPMDRLREFVHGRRLELASRAIESEATRQQLEDENATLRSLDNMRRASNQSVMDGLRKIAVALDDDPPSDLGYVHAVVGIIEWVAKERRRLHDENVGLESSLAALRHEREIAETRWQQAEMELAMDRSLRQQAVNHANTVEAKFRDSGAPIVKDMRRQIASVAEEHPQGVVSMWRVKEWADRLSAILGIET